MLSIHLGGLPTQPHLTSPHTPPLRLFGLIGCGNIPCDYLMSPNLCLLRETLVRSGRFGSVSVHKS